MSASGAVQVLNLAVRSSQATVQPLSRAWPLCALLSLPLPASRQALTVALAPSGASGQSLHRSQGEGGSGSDTPRSLSSGGSGWHLGARLCCLPWERVVVATAPGMAQDSWTLASGPHGAHKPERSAGCRCPLRQTVTPGPPHAGPALSPAWATAPPASGETGGDPAAGAPTTHRGSSPTSPTSPSTDNAGCPSATTARSLLSSATSPCWANLTLAESEEDRHLGGGGGQQRELGQCLALATASRQVGDSHPHRPLGSPDCHPCH